MKRFFPIFVLTAFVMLMLPLTACEDTDDEEATTEEIIAAGKGYLISGDSPAAVDAFEEAVDRAPDNPEAQYGLILANTLHFADLIDELLKLVGDVAGADEMQPLGEMGEINVSATGDQPLGELIQDFVHNVAFPKFEKNLEMYRNLIANGGATFYLNGSYDVQVMDLQLLSMSGEFDTADLNFLGAVNSLVLGVFRIVVAHDINIDFFSLELDFPETDDILVTIGAVVDLIESLLTDPEAPNFLYLDADGAEQMKNAGLDIGFAALYLRQVADSIRAETDDQSDDPIRFIDDNGNGVWDSDLESLSLNNGQLVLDPALVQVIEYLAGDLAVAFFDGTAFDVDPLNPNPLCLSSLNGLLIYLEIFEDPFLGCSVSIPVGPFFAEPAPDGLRRLLIQIIDLWNFIEGFIGG